MTAISFGNKKNWQQAQLFLFRIACTLLLVISLPLLLKAADVLPEFSEKYLAAAEKKHGAGAKSRMQAWSRLISENRAKPELEKLDLVNSFFNKVPYYSDQKHWGRKDYWATPAEMLATNGGDCEDYAIAKYFTLVALGVDNSKLKITYVKAITEAHMVLTYYSKPDAIPLVLDNMIPHIKPANQRPDLKPIYAFNGDGMWLVKSQQLGRVGSSGNIRFWREMKSRMGKEF
ncbi:transglutaminase-like cysteine peptidase [Oxalobacter sp. OttesenSCG-928-P03]|nr:transglutaminase-like cysteine peptidase [Oxalobacter sp. OttesenSCG-928-P03]